MKETAHIQNTDGSNDVSDTTRITWLHVLRWLLIGLTILAGVAFWGTFAYSMWSGNVNLAMIFGQIISVMVSVVVSVAILQKLYRAITKS